MATNLPAGTICYKVGVLHADNENNVVTVEFIIGVVDLTGGFIESSRTQFQMATADFVAAIGQDGQDWSATMQNIFGNDVPTVIAPLVAALNGISFYG